MSSEQVWEDTFAELEQAELLVLIDHARAGNGFFKRIFDQHPEVLGIAVCSYFFHALQPLFKDADRVPWRQAVDYWVEHTNFNFIGKPMTDALRAAFVARGNDPRSEIDRETAGRVFEALLRRRDMVSRRDIILATHVAYLHGTPRPKRGYRYLLLDDSVMGTEGRFILEWIEKDWPKSRIIHLVRDPRANFASLRHQIVNQYGSMYPPKGLPLWRATGSNAVWLWIVQYTSEGAEEMARWARILDPSRFRVVRNEDLNLDFVRTLRGLTAWLGISWFEPWEAEGYVPTADGIPWQGASAYSADFKPGLNGPLANEAGAAVRIPGPSRRNTERWKEHVSTSEIRLLEIIYDEELRRFGYQKLAGEQRTTVSQALKAALPPLLGEVPGRKWLFRVRRDRAIKDVVIRVLYYPMLPLAYVHSRVMFARWFGRRTRRKATL